MMMISSIHSTHVYQRGKLNYIQIHCDVLACALVFMAAVYKLHATE